MINSFHSETLQVEPGNRDLFSKILEVSPVGIVLFNLGGQITQANAQARKILHLAGASGEFPPFHIIDFHGKALPGEMAPVQYVLSTSRPVSDVLLVLEFSAAAAAIVSISASPFFDSAHALTGVVVSVADITTRFREEEKSRQCQQDAGNGQISRTVVHDLNNVLAAIRLHIGVLQRVPELAGSLKDIVNEIENEAVSALDIARKASLWRGDKLGAQALSGKQSAAASTFAGEMPGGSETILLVDDEVLLRRMGALFLRKLGYAVLEAGDGLEAVAVWNQHHAQINLLLTDSCMPHGISGLDLAKRLRKERASLKVIVSSGSKSDGQSLSGQDVFYLPKPYETTTLASIVRHCLDKP